MQILDNLPVRDVYRNSFLELHNVPDTHLTVKSFKMKHGALNVLDINFSTSKNATDYYTEVIDYNHQLYSQILTNMLAQFESFLTNSIRMYLTKNPDCKKVKIPNLEFTKLHDLSKFVMNPLINLLPSVSQEKKDFLNLYRRIRNLVVHNGGYVNGKFIRQYPEYSQQKDKLIQLNKDDIGKLFGFITSSSLKIYNNFVTMK